MTRAKMETSEIFRSKEVVMEEKGNAAWRRMWKLYSSGEGLQEAFHRIVPDLQDDEAEFLRGPRCPSCGHLVALHPHGTACMVCSMCTGVTHE